MQPYNPFDKGINELDTADLLTLRSIREGWYVEYKQELSKADAIAKSISALANTYGGWLFYGIAEESKENSVAGKFIGIERTEVDGALQRIRQAVAGVLNPDCRYEAKALYGPCETIELASDRAVICITVPQSIEAPHIHKKGLIYRRIADGSEPVPENDRYMIEKMFERSKELKLEYSNWIDEDPELSKGEAEHPHIRLMISTNPWRMPRSKFRLDIDSAREALAADGNSPRTIPFDTFYTSSKGVIARQCHNSDPIISRLTWHIFKSLSGDVSIPLRTYSSSPENLKPILENHLTGQLFCAHLEQAKIERVKVVDLNSLFHVITGIFESHRTLLKLADWPCEFSIKIKLINCWRTVPFLDTDFFANHLQKNGIPICLTDNSINPPGSAPNTFIKIQETQGDEAENIKVALQSIRAFIPIAEAFGVPLLDLLGKELSSESNSRTSIYESLLTAGRHSVSLQNKK
ncbi:AlbA family DNA-binding domain-containing protein [Pseudomonas mosselii]|uniref:ATP-binding protein n=1 Tax=Pseudomonas mosselii TaxID=78327 RepID=A0AA42RSM8_9PSED|nr:ATP-binding protein [Pseudomonas mosselii]MDH1629272.1 ATP-binding protein [Pseudomonas mosselii]